MASTLTREEDLAINASIYEGFMSEKEADFKKSADDVTDYTRTRVREDCVQDLITPPLTPTDDQFARNEVDDDLSIIVDLEPDNPGAMTVSYNDFPMQMVINARRYRINFHRRLSRKFAKDVAQLRSWKADLRQIMSDHAVRDIFDTIDTDAFASYNAALVSAGTPLAVTGVAQWQVLYGGISRDSLWESVNVMPSTGHSLEATTAVINHLTAKEFNKFGRTEMGGDMSQDFMVNGFTQRKFLGIDNWIITTKKWLVPNNSIYYFADPQLFGKNFEAEPMTMWAKRDAFMIYFFHYCMRGSAVGNLAGLARVDFR
jgi:hypothetical protein